MDGWKGRQILNAFGERERERERERSKKACL
jgi:hypothetical protein